MNSPRFFVDAPLASGDALALPAAAARHVQVLRLQPGDAIRLFNGRCDAEGEFEACVTQMGRSDVQVSIGAWHPTRCEAARAVHLALVMPANERMDWLVEKAAELGVASITPLMSARSVLRLAGERADKKRTHWAGVASAACEQSGRSRVPPVQAPTSLADWLRRMPDPIGADALPIRLLLSLQPSSATLHEAVQGEGAVTFLSGPEGGLSAEEESAALAQGFVRVTLGPRVLRADTAPLAALAWLTIPGGVTP
jgi:16S rRNA (uracil1498-N3)-methyltransferase